MVLTVYYRYQSGDEIEIFLMEILYIETSKIRNEHEMDIILRWGILLKSQIESLRALHTGACRIDRKVKRVCEFMLQFHVVNGNIL